MSTHEVYVSVKAAAALDGVIVDRKAFAVDEQATENKRAEMAKAR